MTVSHPPVLVTDTRYRASLAAVQSLGRAGYPVAALHTQGDGGAPAAFASKYVKKRVALPCSAKDADYLELLAQVCGSLGEEYGSAPVVFPVGAATLAQLAEHREELEGHARFLVSPPEVLEAANDKRRVGELARSLGVPAPKEYPCPGGALPGKPVGTVYLAGADTRTNTGYLMRLTLGGYQDRQIIRTRAALYALGQRAFHAGDGGQRTGYIKPQAFPLRGRCRRSGG